MLPVCDRSLTRFDGVCVRSVLILNFDAPGNDSDRIADPRFFSFSLQFVSPDGNMIGWDASGPSDVSIRDAWIYGNLTTVAVDRDNGTAATGDGNNTSTSRSGSGTSENSSICRRRVAVEECVVKFADISNVEATGGWMKYKSCELCEDSFVFRMECSNVRTGPSATLATRWRAARTAPQCGSLPLTL